MADGTYGDPDGVAARLLDSTLARMWADEWCRIALGRVAAGEPVIDEGWMTTWFANALETRRRAIDPRAELRTTVPAEPVKVVVYGSSDDLIEVEGAIREEFDVSEEAGLVSFSDGMRLAFEYDGDWHFAVEHEGTRTTVRIEGPDDGGYSDRVTVEGEIGWIEYLGTVVEVRA
jgi:hypothetical protein